MSLHNSMYLVLVGHNGMCLVSQQSAPQNLFYTGLSLLLCLVALFTMEIPLYLETFLLSKHLRLSLLKLRLFMLNRYTKQLTFQTGPASERSVE